MEENKDEVTEQKIQAPDMEKITAEKNAFTADFEELMKKHSVTAAFCSVQMGSGYCLELEHKLSMIQKAGMIELAKVRQSVNEHITMQGQIAAQYQAQVEAQNRKGAGSNRIFIPKLRP